MPDWQATLERVFDAMLPDDGSAWRASVAARAIALLEAQTDLADNLTTLRQFLRVLDMPLAGMGLGGRARGFSSLSRAEREHVLLRMAEHPLLQVRGGLLGLKRLAGALYYADADEHGRNPVWDSLGYPGPVASGAEAPKPIVPLQLSGRTTLECDVVVVGSGAGGGMLAAELAEAGHDVIVLERGAYLTESDFTQLELDMLGKTYLDGGLRTTHDLGMLILAGACLGGGTVVNYTTSFRTPDDVRQDWARVSGLDLFTSDAFTRSLDVACQRLEVNQAHNKPSMRDVLMQRGLRAHGWHVDAMPRDVRDCTQDDVCGYCGLGCVRGAKRSSLKACLEDACACGARVGVGVDVQRVLIERGRAVGVVGVQRATGAVVTVRARKTVIAAGAIGSPVLLLRSGVAGPVGQYLRLHPATAVWGIFDDLVRPWTGTIQALYSDQFAHQHEGYGVRFETTGVHPGFMALGMPWEGAAAYDSLVRRLPHSSLIGILTRDRSSGRVGVTRRGAPVVRYATSTYDQAHVRAGVAGAAQVLAAAGAREVWSTQRRYLPWRIGSESLDAWMARVDGVGYGSAGTLYVSFHQMGTCRMGTDSSTSVTDAAGQTHAVRDLYVADASLFPTASGVNPMVTVAALGHWVAQAVKAVL